MVHLLLVAEEASGGSPLAALGVDWKSLVFQLITFLLVFLVLKKFAFTPITRMLEQRRKVIDDGVKMGLRMEKEKAKLDEQVAAATREARAEADRIIANAHKEAREVIREAEKAAQRKGETMLADTEARIEEERAQSKRKLEKELVGLISEATEAVVGQKLDAKKDAALVDRVMKGLHT